ncbi:hypothetical protein [Modicisalibacter xianhensis]|uniref:hypothetical protein n=1 Tax=Modicisalibacter xianhensis TaxID=442341 RepID=UPI0014170EBF|nr:hypothetical protein [Halomonas xianhensis]
MAIQHDYDLTIYRRMSDLLRLNKLSIKTPVRNVKNKYSRKRVFNELEMNLLLFCGLMNRRQEAFACSTVHGKSLVPIAKAITFGKGILLQPISWYAGTASPS